MKELFCIEAIIEMKEKKLTIGVSDIDVASGKKKIPLWKIAVWNEFGTVTAPPRPAFQRAMESALNDNRPFVQAQLRNIAATMLSNAPNKKAELEKIQNVLLSQIGRATVKRVKDIIKQGTTAPNAPATIKKKGFDHPLYDKGVLLENIKYEVEEN